MKVKRFIFGFVVGLIVAPALGLLILTTCGLPVSTKSAALPFEEYIAKKSIGHAIKNESGKTSPLPADEANFLAGAKLYKTNCAVCHSLPGGAGTAISMGMFPAPPWFFEADQGLDQFPIGNVFWLIKNGIRLTGMPGFQDNLKDEEMWQIALMLQAGKNLPESVKKALTSP